MPDFRFDFFDFQGFHTIPEFQSLKQVSPIKISGAADVCSQLHTFGGQILRRTKVKVVADATDSHTTPNLEG